MRLLQASAVGIFALVAVLGMAQWAADNPAGQGMTCVGVGGLVVLIVLIMSAKADPPAGPKGRRGPK